MSVEAPNNITFSQSYDLKPIISKRNVSLFQQHLKSEQQLYGSRSDYQPKSPQKDIHWLEYSKGNFQSTDDALQKLSTHKKPTLLKFSNSTGPALSSLFKSLPHQKNVQHLIVRHTHFQFNHSQQVARILQLNDGIAWLVLDHNEIDDRGIREIANGLENNSSVVHAILADNNFGDDGARALANTLQKNEHLKSLFIQGNNITDQGIQSIIESLPHAKKLEIIDVRDNVLSASTIKQLSQVCEQQGIRCYT